MTNASRLAVYHDGTVYAQPEMEPALREWGVETMATFVGVMKPILGELRKDLSHMYGL